MARFVAAFFLMAFLNVVATGVVRAQESSQQATSTPSIVLDGLYAYAVDGPEQAIRKWLSQSPYQSDPEILKKIELFKEVHAVYGGFVGYEVLDTLSISAKVKVVLLQLNYEAGPIFGRFLCYQVSGSWIITGNLMFDADPARILPEGFMSGRKSAALAVMNLDKPTLFSKETAEPSEAIEKPIDTSRLKPEQNKKVYALSQLWKEKRISGDEYQQKVNQIVAEAQN